MLRGKGPEPLPPAVRLSGACGGLCGCTYTVLGWAGEGVLWPPCLHGAPHAGVAHVVSSLVLLPSACRLLSGSPADGVMFPLVHLEWRACGLALLLEVWSLAPRQPQWSPITRRLSGEAAVCARVRPVGSLAWGWAVGRPTPAFLSDRVWPGHAAGSAALGPLLSVLRTASAPAPAFLAGTWLLHR